MSIYNIIHKSLVQPLADAATGWGFTNSLNFMNESQWWSKDKLYEYQCLRLQKIVKHAYKSTIYYKELLDKSGINPFSIHTPEDLKRIPILSKEEFRKNFPEKIFANGTSKKSYIKTATSGSTGRQLIYYISKDAYGMINAAGVRGWNWAGYQLGDKYIKITQNKRHNVLKRLQDFINRGHLYTHQYNEAGFSELIKLLNKVKPTVLRSYPDPLIFISNYIIKNKLGVPHIGAVTTTGNTLFKETRQLIEKCFNTKVFDSYSCEGSTHADECATHSCYHLSDEYAITEIIDENGKEVKPGERGLLVTTDLWNYACPFIRYDSRDYVVKSKNDCSCGRGLASLERIDGRDNDILITPDGNFLIAQTFTTYFKYFESIEQFQVVQNSSDTLLFKLVTNKNYNTDIENNIIKYWEDYTNKTMKIFVEPIKEISLRMSGKRQFLVRDPSIKLYE